MANRRFKAFDADQHYYEAEDAFIRHVDRGMRWRCMQWAEVEGKKRLLVGGRVNRFIPNPTFDPVARPGCIKDFLMGRNPENKSMAELFGRLEPISPAYRDREARLARMDEQGIEGAFLFPTLGVGMQESLRDDPEAARAAFRGFNRWLEEDWGFAHAGRLFAAPYISLIDPDWAEQEAAWAIARGARILCMVPGPVPTRDGGRSPADPIYDRFWARVAEAGLTVTFHSGDAGYRAFTEAWSDNREFRAFDFIPLLGCLSPDPMHDTFAALICQGLFDRFPRLRVASIEAGSDWVPGLVHKLEKTYGRMPGAFKSDPVERLRNHCWVAPFFEDDLAELRELIGVGQILFSSDWPHAEGLAAPLDFLEHLQGFSQEEMRLILYDNARRLLEAP